MLDHVTIRVADLAASERFYDTVLATLGIEPTHRADTVSRWRDFSLRAADDATPPTERLHVGFAAASRARVDEFWRAGTQAGYPDDGEPGPRPEYRSDYYGAFLLDPDGNSAEAVHHGALPEGGMIDHLWMRTSDLTAAKRFYETIAPYAGLRAAEDTPDRVRFVTGRGSFSLVQGPATRNLHLAFGTTDDGEVERFHRAATDAGYRSNGPPGERARHHPGYHAAYVLDPDGNNVEVVNHNRG